MEKSLMAKFNSRHAKSRYFRKILGANTEFVGQGGFAFELSGVFTCRIIQRCVQISRDPPELTFDVLRAQVRHDSIDRGGASVPNCLRVVFIESADEILQPQIG